MIRRFAPLLIAAALLAACGETPAPVDVVKDYTAAPVPAVPERTHAVDATWAAGGNGALADGQYWATTVTAQGGSLAFDVSQALFGPACEQAGGSNCVDGYASVPDPHGTLTLPASVVSLPVVSVVGSDREDYSVSLIELRRLVAGGAPAGAPATYHYSPYPYLLTVHGGQVQQIQQIWAAAP